MCHWRIGHWRLLCLKVQRRLPPGNNSPQGRDVRSAAESSAAWWSSPSLWLSSGYSKDPSPRLFYSWQKVVETCPNLWYHPARYMWYTHLGNIHCFWLRSLLCWGWSWVTGPGYLEFRCVKWGPKKSKPLPNHHALNSVCATYRLLIFTCAMSHFFTPANIKRLYETYHQGDEQYLLCSWWMDDYDYRAINSPTI